MRLGIYLQLVLCCTEYMLQKLGMEAATVPELCYSLYKTYGTTMAGLRVQFNLTNLSINLYANTLFYANRMIIELFIFSRPLPGNWLRL